MEATLADRLFKTPLRALDANGDPVSGAKAYFYRTGTSTPITTYTDSGGGAAQPFPLVADSDGVFAEIYVNLATGIKVNVTDSAGTSLGGYPVDSVFKESSTSNGAGSVSFAPTTEIPVANAQDAIELVNNIVNDTTPQLGGNLDTNKFSVDWSKGADVASATELLLLRDGNSVDVTGTTTITSIETTADAIGIGTHYTLQFDGILTLTHHATNLVLPGGANITTAAGDIAVMYKYAAGDWRSVSYSKASGEPVVVVVVNPQIPVRVNFNAQGTIAVRESVGLSSITDNGVGAFTLNFSVTMASADYTMTASGQYDETSINAGVPRIGVIRQSGAMTTTSVKISVESGMSAGYDALRVMIGVIGETV